MRNPNTFAGNPLDRASERRTDPAWLKAQLDAPTSGIVPFVGDRPLIRLGEDGATAAFLPPPLLDEPLGAPVDAARCLFLGLMPDGAPRFALRMPDHVRLEDDPLIAAQGKAIDLRSIAPDLAPADAAMLAQAKALLAWHETHRHCARCGARSHRAEGGYKRVCEVCAGEHFPRTDPVVIMLVTDGDQCMLGRGAAWEPGRFSTLAGFVEPGETFEEACAREVFEEARIRVGDVRYVFSQPWPWPMSIMVGLHATAETREITVDPAELAEARWFSRAEIEAGLKGEAPFRLPPPLAIAHQLMRAWLDG
ncbi:NAD(+) diphosphatase [Futiania mangrovi]|uniref:NAD(+) diphosphatase n=1 Tax=Futiania mangrovi TaxID=2959716 RepID=A0A9J6PGE0_9PROT|nr:NAD(+) diphosphatase [Futiania mangrovii]MCP1336888.1 NAD(+) diphosphatase [Futiania mangrovii]